MTSKEFAKLIGVSQSTISRAMNNSGLVSEERRNYIQKKALEYGFVLNSQARSLKTNRTGTVGILFPKHFSGMHQNLSLAYLYDLVQKELRKYGYDVMVVYDSDHNHVDMSLFERTIKRHKVDGFIVLRLDFSPEEIELIHRYKVPCVYLLHAAAKDPYSSSCTSDSIFGGYLVGQRFGKFKDFTCYYLGVNEISDSLVRLKGFTIGLEEQGVSLSEENILSCDLSIKSAYECIIEHQKIFGAGKCAVFAYNDMMALGAVHAFQSLGLKIPDDVQIAGMDNQPLLGEFSPKLSTISLQYEKIATIGCELLRKEIEGVDDSVIQTVIKPQFIQGETTL